MLCSYAAVCHVLYAGSSPVAASSRTSLILQPRSLLCFKDLAYTHCLHGIDEVRLSFLFSNIYALCLVESSFQHHTQIEGIIDHVQCFFGMAYGQRALEWKKKGERCPGWQAHLMAPHASVLTTNNRTHSHPSTRNPHTPPSPSHTYINMCAGGQRHH